MEGAIAQKPQQWLYTCDPTGIHNPVCPWLIRQSSDKRDTRTETKSFTVALCCPPHLPAGNVNACWSWVTFLCDEEGIDVEQRTSFSPPPPSPPPPEPTPIPTQQLYEKDWRTSESPHACCWDHMISLSPPSRLWRHTHKLFWILCFRSPLWAHYSNWTTRDPSIHSCNHFLFLLHWGLGGVLEPLPSVIGQMCQFIAGSHRKTNKYLLCVVSVICRYLQYTHKKMF